MTTPGGPKITSTGPGDNRRTLPARVPKRGELAAATVEVLKEGSPTKADLLVVDLGQGPMVVKDFGKKVWWMRQFGRLQIRHEVKAYRFLEGLPGIPRLLGRIDRYALALEKIEGRQLGSAPERLTRGTELMPRLRAIVERMHEAGLVHWDLRGRENVLVRPDGELFVLDFQSAMWARPGGWPHRLLFPTMKRVDDAAMLKWKQILQAGPYTPAEEEFLRRYRFWRSFWIINPKARKARRGDS